MKIHYKYYKWPFSIANDVSHYQAGYIPEIPIVWVRVHQFTAAWHRFSSQLLASGQDPDHLKQVEFSWESPWKKKEKNMEEHIGTNCGTLW